MSKIVNIVKATHFLSFMYMTLKLKYLIYPNHNLLIDITYQASCHSLVLKMTPKRQEYSEDTFYTMQNLYCLLKLFAMDFTIRCGAQITTKWSWIRVACVITVLSFLSGTSLYWKMAKFYLDLDNSITVTDAVESIYDYMQYVVDLYFISTLGCNCKLEYYNYYKNIDIILGFKKYSAVKKEIDTLLMGFSAAWFISCSLDYTGWTMSFEYIRATVFAVVYIYIAGKLLTFLDLVSNTINLDYRLGAISEILEYYYDKEPNENASCLSMVDPISNDKWIHTKSNKTYILQGRVYKITPVEGDRKENVRWLSKCYLLLDEQCNFINRMFGFRVSETLIKIIFEKGTN